MPASDAFFFDLIQSPTFLPVVSSGLSPRRYGYGFRRARNHFDVPFCGAIPESLVELGYRIRQGSFIFVEGRRLGPEFFKFSLWYHVADLRRKAVQVRHRQDAPDFRGAGRLGGAEKGFHVFC